MVEITVIMPVYNGERWLTQTLKSLQNQTFQDFEVLCVDDCSSDRSHEILQHFAEGDNRFKVLRCSTNQGIVPKVINFAKPSVRGKYFAYTSQDDLFSTNWLEAMHVAQHRTDADAVLPDLEFFYEGGTQNKRLVGLSGDRSVELSGDEAFLLSLDWKISGNALWPARFLQDPGFSDFGTFADEYSVRHFYLHCEKVVFCDGVFFYRQDNPNAITKKVSPKLLDVADNNYRLWRLCRDHRFADDVLAVRAYHTMRSLIKAQALISDHPELRAQAGLVEQCFAKIQSSEFSDALQHHLASNSGLAKRALYSRAQRSMRWLTIAAQLSAIAGRVKRRK